MPNLQKTTGDQNYNHLPLWKGMTVVTAILFSGGSLATLVPSQAVYAHSNRPNTSHHTRHKEHKEAIKLLFICKAGNGGKGGSSIKKSNGAMGGTGGNCDITLPLNIFLTGKNNKIQGTSTSYPQTTLHSAGQSSSIPTSEVGPKSQNTNQSGDQRSDHLTSY